MLGDINFQRKKEFSSPIITTTQYISNMQNDQTKNLYDFVLRLDSQIKNLEKDISILKTEYITLSTRIPSLEKNEDKLTKNDLAELILTTQQNQNKLNEDDIKILIKTEISKAFKEKFSKINEDIINIKTENIEYGKNIDEVIEQQKKLSNQFSSIKDESLCNTRRDNSKDFENVIKRQLQKDKIEIKNSINEINQKTENYFNEINKRINDFDLDFDRLIESLKTQFQSVSESITQIDKNKINTKEFENILKMHKLNKNDINNSRNNNFFPSSKNKKHSNSLDNNNNQTHLMKSELIQLRNEINADFEKINIKILTELQNQANDIKNLYQEIHDIDTLSKNNNFLNTNTNLPSNINNNNNFNLDENITFNNILSSIENELSKKANIEQLNYALETQAKINDAFCSANRTAKWSWSNDGLLKNKFIIWSIQNINTALDLFIWENENNSIVVSSKGIYKVCVGLISLDNKDNFSILINDEIIFESEYERNSINELNQNNIILYIDKYIALMDNSRIQVKINSQNECNGEAFIEITKII